MMNRSLLTLSLIALLGGCATNAPTTAATGVAHVAIFGINDFHGNIQATAPTPRMVDLPDPDHPDKKIAVPTGGIAYLASELNALRQANPHSITVGLGDLIGGSPVTSSLLDDEPTIEALNQIDLAISVVGNHEFDNGREALEQRIKGICPAKGCKLAGFKGARFTYLAANVLDRNSGKPFLTPYVIREIDGVKVGFVGTPLHDVPTMVMAAGIQSLRFADEVETINALVPEIKAKGATTIVALVHQGADFAGPFNDPTYKCDGLTGPIIDLTKRLDPAVKVVMSAHTHNAYTCKIDGRLLTQGYNYGALVSTVRLDIDRASGEVISADATNQLVDQRSLTPDPQLQQFVDKVAATTTVIRNQPVGQTTQQLTRKAADSFGDSALGNLVADAQLAYAKRFGKADIAFTNSGGLRAELPSTAVTEGKTLTYGDLYAVQPFRNSLVVMTLSGKQILTLLRNQWPAADAGKPGLLQISGNLHYRWSAQRPVTDRVIDVTIDGKPLDPTRNYRVAINAFLAGGGDGAATFKEGADTVALPGLDVDALRWYVENRRKVDDYRSEGRIQKITQ